MLLQVDTRQKRGHHKAKEKWFAENGITTVSSKLLVGDYALPSKMKISVDTKASISELYTNLIQQHDRFHNECTLAQEAGIKLYILIENNEGVSCVEDLKNWENPLMLKYWKTKKNAQKTGAKVPKPPVSNVQLIKIIHAMSRDYGVEFLFCKPEDAGMEIIRLLNGEGDE